MLIKLLEIGLKLFLPVYRYRMQKVLKRKVAGFETII